MQRRFLFLLRPMLALKLELSKIVGLAGMIIVFLDSRGTEHLIRGCILLVMVTIVIYMQVYIPMNLVGVRRMIMVSQTRSERRDVFHFGGKLICLDCDYGEYAGIDLDSIAVWISSEKPVVGTNEGVDTGFVNTEAFTLLGEGKPSCDNWNSFSYDLSSYSDQDAWLLIQAAKKGIAK